MSSRSGAVGRFWRRLGLAKKIVVLAFAGSAVVVSTFAVLAIWSLNQSVDRSKQERLVLATASADSLDQYNATVIQQLNQVGQAVEAQIAASDFAGAASTLRDTESMPGFLFRDLIIADISGKIVAAQPRGASAPGTSLVQLLGTWALPKGTDSSYVSNIAPSPMDGTPSIFYAVPLFDGSGEPLGILAGEMSIQSSSIGGFISAIKLGRTGYAQVVDGKGDLIASTQPEQVFGNVDHGDRFVALIQGHQSVVRTCHNCHEPVAGATTRRKDILAFAPLQTATWGVAVRQSEAEAFAETTKLREGMLIVGIVALALAFPGTIAIASRTIRPILSLTEASKRMSAGDLTTVVPEVGEDEIGTLGQNLEFMRKGLKDSHEEIERRRREAESLYDIGVKISALLDTDRILGSVVDEAKELTGADVCFLMTCDERGQLSVKATSGELTPAFKGLSLKQGGGFAGAVVERQRPLAAEDYLIDLSFEHEPSVDTVINEEGLRSYLGVPLKFADRVLGALVVARRQVRSFSDQETGLLDRLGNQASIAITNANLYQEVRLKEDLRGQLLEKVIAAQEDERKRIARELHDEPAQIFSALSMQLEAMANELPATEAPVKERLQKLQRLAAHALETVRKLMSDLRPTALDDLGLIPAIRQYAEGRLSEIGAKVTVRVSNMGQRLPANMETVIFRVLQEAVNNVYKHAEARNVIIELKREKRMVSAVVRDDGIGFRADAQGSATKRGGLGLIGIRERVGLLGGVLRVKSQPGKGTELRIEIPLGEGE